MEYIEITKTLLSEPWFIAACIGDLAMIVTLVWCYNNIKSLIEETNKLKNFQVEFMVKEMTKTPEDNRETLLTRHESAKFLGISVATLSKGKIKVPFQKVVNKTMYRMSDLIEAKKAIKKRKPYIRKNTKNFLKQESSKL